MSGSTARSSVRAAAGTASFLDRCRKLTTTGVRSAAFWGAVLLPLASVAALAAGLAGQHPVLFLGLLVANVVCFVIGHEYSPDR